MKKKVSEKPMEIRMQGYEVIEKTVTQHATSAKVLVQKRWIGKRVRAVRLDPESEEDKKEDRCPSASTTVRLGEISALPASMRFNGP